MTYGWQLLLWRFEVRKTSGALPLLTGVTWQGVTKEQCNTGVLALMTGVAPGVGLLVIEALTGPDWGLEL